MNNNPTRISKIQVEELKISILGKLFKNKKSHMIMKIKKI